MKHLFETVKIFKAENEKLIDSSFISFNKIVRSSSILKKILTYIVGRFLSLYYKAYPLYCLIRIFLYNNKVVRAQFILRKGGLKGSYQWERLWELKQYLDLFKPKSILELGSGGSTILFHLYSVDRNIKFVSLEEDEAWRDSVCLAAKIVGLTSYGDLRNQVKLGVRIQKEDQIEKEIICHFEVSHIHSIPFDFVYIDGPTNWLHAGGVSGFISDSQNTLPNADVSLLKSLPKIVLIDGRRSTIRYIIRRNILDNYFISLSRKYSHITFLTLVKRHPYHTIFYKT